MSRRSWTRMRRGIWTNWMRRRMRSRRRMSRILRMSRMRRR